MSTTDPRLQSAAPVPSPAELLDIALSASTKAADYLRALNRDDLAREYKTSSHDIVTEHDRASEEIIVAELRRLMPDCRIVGEEGGVRAADAEQAAEPDPSTVSFFVDPIDGTSNFAAGLPLFCISIGVAVGQELVAGVIELPILGTVFSAADGPAMVNGVPIQPRSTRAPKDAMVLSGFPGRRVSEEFPQLAGQANLEMHLSFSAVRHIGAAAIELAYVAAGWADATGLASINPWDVAAGFHIVRRAGGSLRTWPGNGPFDAPDHLRPAYVACAGPERLAVFDGLMDQVQAARDAAR